MNNLMKFTFIAVLATTPLLAQTGRNTADPNQTSRNTADSNQTSDDRSGPYNETRGHHDLGWIGLIGLAGLAGLRHRSGAQDRMESHGVNVKAVRT
jgi:MYXO-CTERM domain-containing protein